MSAHLTDRFLHDITQAAAFLPTGSVRNRVFHVSFGCTGTVQGAKKSPARGGQAVRPGFWGMCGAVRGRTVGTSHADYILYLIKEALHRGNYLLHRLHKSDNLRLGCGHLVQRILHLFHARLELVCVELFQRAAKSD